ncbi:MAG: hypothetical protein ABI861_13750 [Panacibacter sp.]
MSNGKAYKSATPGSVASLLVGAGATHESWKYCSPAYKRNKPTTALTHISAIMSR